MNDSQKFLSWWLINSFLFYFTPFILSGMVVTGNARLAPFLAGVISGFVLTVFDALVLPTFNYFKIKLKEEWQWGLAYLFVNVLGIWLIARYADLTGVGISNAWVAVLLGVLVTVLQLGSNKFLFKK